MITGDLAVTAAAISGREWAIHPPSAAPSSKAMSDEELKAALPRLHMFGRVTPEDKLRLARLMQEDGAKSSR